MSSSSPRPFTPADAAQIAAGDAALPWQALEDLAHIDPAGRGLASFRRDAAPLDAGQLRGAAVDLARHATSVAIVTGFCVVFDDAVTAETDGPPSALFLARSLAAQGIEVCLISDKYGLPLLAVGCDLLGLDRSILVEAPFEDDSPDGAARQSNLAQYNQRTDRWVADFLASPRGQRLTHLVSIERPGPSHTLESLAAQPRDYPAPLEPFAVAVPPDDWGLCHNMRGHSINAYTAKTHRLFETVAERRLPIRTIGIGDGGNEIGMGRFLWELLVDAVDTDTAAMIACRIATDFTIIGGTSDWAAYALALAVARLRGNASLDSACNSQTQRTLIERLVAEAYAVDGLTCRLEPTVDGLPLEIYLRPLEEASRLLGF